jgi:hypothetical protein
MRGDGHVMELLARVDAVFQSQLGPGVPGPCWAISSKADGAFPMGLRLFASARKRPQPAIRQKTSQPKRVGADGRGTPQGVNMEQLLLSL